MKVVGGSAPEVERVLSAGLLKCPACSGSLRPWGMARPRVIHVGNVLDLAVRPRRARCSACYATHVLLPDWLLSRRAYSADIMWRALVAHATGMGYRRIALRLRVPESTVRDWLRTFRRLAPGALLGLAGSGRTPGAAVLALERAAATGCAWRSAVRATGGQLLANTSSPQVPRSNASEKWP